MTYEEAINLTKQGNEYGFQYLYDTTYKSCLYAIGEILKDSVEAEDVLQDAYMSAIKKIDTLKDPEKFPAWFKTLASRLAIDHIRKNKKTVIVNPGEDESPESVMDRMVNEQLYAGRITPEEAYESKETSRLLHELIDELPEEQRQCILLFYMEDYSIKDIAKACKCSESTVKSRLKYGKNKLEEKTTELQKKGYVLQGVAPVYLITWLLKTDMVNKLKFVYGSAATSAFSHTMFSKLVNAGLVTVVNSGLTNAVGSGMNNTVQSGMTNMVNSGMTTAAGETISSGTTTVAEGTAAVNAGTAVAGTAAKGAVTGAIKGGIHTIAGKIITGVSIAVISGGLVTAAVVTNINNDTAENEPTTEVTGALISDESSEEVTTEATTTEVTTETTSEEITTEEAASSTPITGNLDENPYVYYEDMYSDVIESYIILINEWLPDTSVWPFDDEFDAKYPWLNNYYGITTALFELNPTLNDIGYWIHDIDGNGIPELLILGCSDNFVYGLFTVIDDEIVTIAGSIARDAFYYCGDNYFCEINSANWINVFYNLYTFESNKLDFIEAVFTDLKSPNNYNELAYYYSSSYDYPTYYTSEYHDSTTTEISESEFESKKNEYLDGSNPIPGVTPLSEY